MANWLEMLPSLGGNMIILALVGLFVRHWFASVNKRLERMPRDFRLELEEMRDDIKSIQLAMARTETTAGSMTTMREDIKQIQEKTWKHGSQLEALFMHMDRCPSECRDMRKQ